MITRKNVRSLTPGERQAFVNALLTLKAEGRHDKFVHWHHEVMRPAVLSFEPHDSLYCNGAHRGPAFLPWHREFLLQPETQLCSVDPSLSIPYWDRSEDVDNPTTAIVWSEDFMGGDGIESDEWRIATGPLAHQNGQWPVPDYSAGGRSAWPRFETKFWSVCSDTTYR